MSKKKKKDSFDLEKISITNVMNPLSKKDVSNIRSILKEPNRAIQKFKSAINFNSIKKDASAKITSKRTVILTGGQKGLDELDFLTHFLYRLHYESRCISDPNTPNKCLDYLLDKIDNLEWKLVFLSHLVNQEFIYQSPYTVSKEDSRMEQSIISASFGIRAIEFIEQQNLYKILGNKVKINQNLGLQIANIFSITAFEIVGCRDLDMVNPLETIEFYNNKYNNDVFKSSDVALDYGSLALKISPNDIRYKINLKYIYKFVRDFESSIKYIQHEEKISKDLIDTFPDLAKYYELLYFKATHDKSEKDYEGLEDTLNYINQELKKEENPYGNDIYKYRAFTFYNLGLYHESIHDCDLILDDEELHEIYNIRAVSKYKLGKQKNDQWLIEQSLEDINKSIELAQVFSNTNQVAQYLYDRIDIYRELGKPEEAIFDKIELDNIGYDVDDYKYLDEEVALKFKEISKDNQKTSTPDLAPFFLDNIRKVSTSDDFEKLFRDYYTKLIKKSHKKDLLNSEVYSINPELGLLFTNIIFMKRYLDCSNSEAWDEINNSNNPIKALIDSFNNNDFKSDNLKDILISKLINFDYSPFETPLNQVIRDISYYKWSKDKIKDLEFNRAFSDFSKSHLKSFDKSHAFSTNTRLARFIIKMMEIKKSSVVYDAACGSGEILTQLSNKKIQPKLFIGQDIELVPLSILKMKLHLAGVEYSINNNSLSSPPKKKIADYAILDIDMFMREHKSDSDKIFNDYINHLLGSLKKNGKAIIVIPTYQLNNGELFKEKLFDKKLETVITLPKLFDSNLRDDNEKVFTRSFSILVLSKSSNEKIRLIDGNNKFLRITENFSNSETALLNVYKGITDYIFDFKLDVENVRDLSSIDPSDFIPSSVKGVSFEHLLFKAFKDNADIKNIYEKGRVNYGFDIPNELTHTIITRLSILGDEVDVLGDNLENIDEELWNLNLPELDLTVKEQIEIIKEKIVDAVNEVEGLKQLHQYDKNSLKLENCILKNVIDQHYKDKRLDCKIIFKSKERPKPKVYIDKEVFKNKVLAIIDENLKKHSGGNAISTYEISVEGNNLKIYYSNNGNPLDKNINPEQFFSRDSLPQKKGGTGYGRKMIDKYILMFGGFVEMDNSAHKTFGFNIFLPLVDEKKKQR